jgi:ribonuclease P protein component
VLDRRHRLTSSVLFTTAARRGRRTGTRTVVLHLLTDRLNATGPDGPVEPQVGFVVSKAVGNAVTRNAVKRRLRHLARTRVSTLPGRSVLVVRALPPASEATYAELGSDLDAALHRLRRLPQAGRRPGGRAVSPR